MSRRRSPGRVAAAGGLCLTAVLSGTVACHRDPEPVVTIHLAGQRSGGGACPTPPGRPGACLEYFRTTATFRESGGGSAFVRDVVFQSCRGDDCDDWPPHQEPPANADHVLPPHGTVILTFSPLYFTIGRPERVVLRARIVWLEGEYPLEAQLAV
jgi:hypothetical protein